MVWFSFEDWLVWLIGVVLFCICCFVDRFVVINLFCLCCLVVLLDYLCLWFG